MATASDPYAKLERVDEFLEAARESHQAKLDSLGTARRKTAKEIQYHEDLQEFRENSSGPAIESKLSQYRKRLQAIKTARRERKELLTEIHEARTIVARLRLADGSDLDRWLGPLDEDLGLEADAAEDVETLRAVIQVLEQLADRCLSDEELETVDDEPSIEDASAADGADDIAIDTEVLDSDPDPDGDIDSAPESLLELGEDDEFTDDGAELGDH